MWPLHTKRGIEVWKNKQTNKTKNEVLKYACKILQVISPWSGFFLPQWELVQCFPTICYCSLYPIIPQLLKFDVIFILNLINGPQFVLLFLVILSHLFLCSLSEIYEIKMICLIKLRIKSIFHWIQSISLVFVYLQ